MWGQREDAAVEPVMGQTWPSAASPRHFMGNTHYKGFPGCAPADLDGALLSLRAV